MEFDGGEVTRLLHAVRNGDSSAKSKLMEVLYPALRQLADRQLRRENVGHTLQPTALLHELYIKMIEPGRGWHDRVHFFSCAAKAMRLALIDHARQKAAQKRGAGCVRIEVDDVSVAGGLSTDELLDLDQALDRLAEQAPRAAQVVELRFFAGMTEDEISGVLEKSVRTIKRDWVFARAWLFHQLRGVAAASNTAGKN